MAQLLSLVPGGLASLRGVAMKAVAAISGFGGCMRHRWHRRSRFIVPSVMLYASVILAERGAAEAPAGTVISDSPYACVPAAAAFVLGYLNRPEPFASVRAEMAVRQDGRAPLADLVRVVEKRDLHAAGLTGLSLPHVESYASTGHAIVVVIETAEFQHAIAVVGVGVGGDLYATDLLSPIRRVDKLRLQELLRNNVLCLVIGESAITPPTSPSSPLKYVLMGVSVGIPIVLYIVWWRSTGKGAANGTS